MTTVATRELRNDTAGLLRRVRAGEELTIAVNGQPVAQLTALRPPQRRWLSRAELLARLRVVQADPRLRDDLARLAGETTESSGRSGDRPGAAVARPAGHVGVYRAGDRPATH